MTEFNLLKTSLTQTASDPKKSTLEFMDGFFFYKWLIVKKIQYAPLKTIKKSMEAIFDFMFFFLSDLKFVIFIQKIKKCNHRSKLCTMFFYENFRYTKKNI